VNICLFFFVKVFLKKFKIFIFYFKLIFFLIFLDYFDMLISKIIFKNKKYHFNIFFKKIILKNNYRQPITNISSHS